MTKKIGKNEFKKLLEGVLSEATAKKRPTKQQLQDLIAYAQDKYSNQNLNKNKLATAVKKEATRLSLKLDFGEYLSISNHVRLGNDLDDDLKDILGSPPPPSGPPPAPPIPPTQPPTQPPTGSNNYGKTVQVGQSQHKVKVPKKANMPQVQNQFSFDLQSIPDELKKAILRTFQSYLNSQTAVSDLAKISENLLNEDTTNLDWEDFAAILSDRSSPLFRPAVKAVRQIANTDPTAPYAADLQSMLSQRAAASSAEVTPSTPSIDVSDLYGANRQNVPAYVVAAFDAMGLGQTNSVQERIKFINSYSDRLMQSTPDTTNMELGEIMGSIAVINGLARIVQRMDDKAAGWAFESFLAQLVNGTTEGTAMGAADFVFGIGPDDNLPPDTKGSAKLMSSNSFSQSTTTMSNVMPGFAAAPATGSTDWDDFDYTSANGKLIKPTNQTTPVNWGNKKMVYIMGLKKDSSGSGTAASDKIVEVELYFVEIERTQGQGRIKQGDLTVTNASYTVDSSIKFTSVSNPIGTIKLASDLSEIDKFGKAALDAVDQNIPKLINQMEVFSRSTKGYLTGGKADDVNKAVEGYAAMYELINKVFGAPNGQSSTGAASQQSGVTAGVQASSSGVTATKATALAEQKITANFLKKLIKESFKK